jgi:protein-tyrosine-phosphatase
VCDQAHEELAAAGQSDAIHWSIPDPVRHDTNQAFEAAFDDIRVRVARLADAWPPSPDSTPRSMR